MAIDQEIQRKVDAYRGNPQALQQRYAQNQQLIDLLALQKLKSEMDAAKRDMQMKMEQQPGTIKQQREQELLQRTKDDMVQQTQGVLQQRQVQQQQNLQRAAQGGIGALAPQQPPAPSPAQQVANQSQPVPRMAAGGIVAFQPGGYVGGVTQEEIEAFRASRRGQGSRAVRDLSDAEIAERIAAARADVPRSEDPNYELTRRGFRPVSDRPVETAAPIERLVDQEPPPQEGPLGGAGAIIGPTPPAAGIAAVTPPVAPPPAGPEGGLATLTSDSTAETGPSFADSSAEIIENIGSTDLPDRSGIGSGGAEAAMERGFARADDYTNRAGVAERYAEMESRLAEFDAGYDPAEERSDQLKAFLIGTAGRGSTALAGGAAASLNLRRNQRDSRRERLMQQFALAERGMGLDRDLATVGMQLGREMYAQVSQNARTAAQIAASADQAELRAALDRAQMEYDRLKDDRQFGLDEREARVAELNAATSARNVDLDTLAAVTKDLREDQISIYDNLRENSALPQLELAQMSARDEEEAASIQAQIDAIESDLILQTEEILNEMGWLGIRDRTVARLYQLTGMEETGSLSMEDVAGITGPGRE